MSRNLDKVDDDQLHDLRRAAFRRGASAADVAKLAAYEESVRARAVVDVEDVDDDVEPAVIEPEPEEHDPEPEPVRRRRGKGWIVAAAIVAALGAGLGGGWFLAGYTAPPEPVSSLAVFDRPQTVADTQGEDLFTEQPFAGWDAGQVFTDVRELGEFPDAKIYGALSDIKDGSSGKPESLVCIAITDTKTQVVGCTLREDFLRYGLQPLRDAASDQPSYAWGPFGPPVDTRSTPVPAD